MKKSNKKNHAFVTSSSIHDVSAEKRRGDAAARLIKDLSILPVGHDGGGVGKIIPTGTATSFL